MSKPRRLIALGPPHDDGTVPKPPEQLTDDERLDRIERNLERIADTLHVITDLRRARLRSPESDEA
jgi:hypothetical protein